MTRRAGLREQRGFFAIGIEAAKCEANVGTLWRTANLYDAAYIFTVGERYRRQASDTMQTPRHVPLLHFTDLEDLYAHLPHDTPLVGVELDDRACLLARFQHPRSAVYLLGAEDHGLSKAALTRCDQLVQLPGAYSMNVAVAGSIVLYDRVAKSERVDA